MAALRRRADGKPVEVYLEVLSFRLNNQEVLRLKFAGEQEIEEELEQANA